MTTASLQDEILAALQQTGPARGYQVGRWIEAHTSPRPWRFLWWSGMTERMIPFGTLYRALDGLVEEGILTRTKHVDGDNPPTFVYDFSLERPDRP